MTDAKLQAMTKRFKGWKGKVTKYWSEKLGESIKVGNWVRKVSPSSDKVENQVKVSKCRIESIWKVRNQVREKTCCYVSSHSVPILPSRRQTWKALVHNICVDPSMAFFSVQSFCSQSVSGPLHGGFFAKFLLTIYVRTPPWCSSSCLFTRCVRISPSWCRLLPFPLLPHPHSKSVPIWNGFVSWENIFRVRACDACWKQVLVTVNKYQLPYESDSSFRSSNLTGPSSFWFVWSVFKGWSVNLEILIRWLETQSSLKHRFKSAKRPTSICSR